MIREVKVVKHSDRELILEIYGEDHTLGNMIAKEALKHPAVEYAAYRIPHPLQDKMEFYLVVKEGYDLGQVLVEVCEKLKQYLKEFRDKVEEVLSEA